MAPWVKPIILVPVGGFFHYEKFQTRKKVEKYKGHPYSYDLNITFCHMLHFYFLLEVF